MAQTCSDDSASRADLSAAVNFRYSWVGENRHVVTTANSIDTAVLETAFNCWLSGISCSFNEAYRSQVSDK